MKYPNHRIFAIFDEGEDASHSLVALLRSGIPKTEIEIFHAGVDEVAVASKTMLDGVFGEHLSQFPMGDVEDESFRIYHAALDKGGIVLSIRSETDERKESTTQILAEHHAHSLNYFGTWTVEALDPPPTQDVNLIPQETPEGKD